MKYDTSEVDELIDWVGEADFNANRAPPKWVLRAEQEMRRMKERIEELEGVQ